MAHLYEVRKYYFIKSTMNGLVVDVRQGNPNPGAKLIMWHQKETDADNQLFYDDRLTGTIRCKLNDFCIDIEGNNIVLNPWRRGASSQAWERDDDRVIRNRENGKHFDIAGGRQSPETEVYAWDYHGKSNQIFQFEHAGYERYMSARKHFYIVSEMNGKVLDIKGGKDEKGAKVIMWHRKDDPEANQLWYMDARGYIKSVLNNMAFEASERGKQLRMVHYSGEDQHQWRLHGNKIVNDLGEALDIKGSDSDDGAKVISYDDQGSANQQWRFDYI